MTQDATETPRIDVTRTELVWPGKYSPDGTLSESPRVNLPFQVIERINETRATREAQKKPHELSLFDVWEGDDGETFDSGWRNKLIWGDNLLVMSSLLQRFGRKIDLIYIDPPFATGADFSFESEIGDSGLEVEKEQSIIEEVAYRDTWSAGQDSYLTMMVPRLALARQLLSDRGSIFLHCDYRMVHHLREVLDELFGIERLENEIQWCYSVGGRSPKRFARKHDTILFYSRTGDFTFNGSHADVVVPRKPNSHMKVRVDPDGREYQEKVDRKSGKAYRYYMDEGKTPEDYWTDIEQLNREDAERVGYATQKPEKLLRRIIASVTNPGDLVADFFVGSGTTCAAAEKLDRRWIGCDLSRWSVHVTRKRLLDIENAQPFEILNLGQYERQYWQGVTFGGERSTKEQTLYEYLAFILRLYGAEPVSGLAHLHGKKGKAMIHVGSVDAPVTIDEIMAAVQECSELKQAELHVLGWEWEMGLYDLMVDEAKKLGVKLMPLQIPREVMEQQAVDKGHIQFFELAHLEVSVHIASREVSAQLEDFVIPNTELIPDDVREKVKKWSDYIDYWAVDWNFQDDTFMQGWVAYRTRKDRKLELVSDSYTFEEPGSYTIVVKVIDVFGNDTSQAYEIEVE